MRGGALSKRAAVKALFFYMLYRCGLIRNGHILRKRAYLCMAGLRVEDCERICNQYADARVAHVFKEAQYTIRWHRDQGHILVLLSSSLDPVVNGFARHLGISHCRGTEIASADGMLTGMISGVDPWGSGKVAIAAAICQIHSVSPMSCYAYADHWSDLPLLQFVGHPMAINPDRNFKNTAARAGIPVAIWSLEKTF